MWVYSELILEIVFQIVIIPCRDSLVGRSVRMKIWMSLVQLRSALNNPGSWQHALLFLFLSFCFALFTFLNQISLFLHLHTKEELFLKVEQMFSVSIQTNHCERKNLEITPKIIVLLKIQCSKNFLGLTGPSIAFEII